MKSRFIQSFLVAALLLVFAQCTEPEETMSWRPGSGLHIVGGSEVKVGSTGNYYVDGHTINEEYTWTVNGSPVTPTREGQFISVTFANAGDYVITVSNGRLTGETTVVAAP